MIEKIDCETCKTAVLADDNTDVWDWIQNSWHFLVRPGGIDPAGIELLIRRYRVDDDEQPLVIDKIMAYAAEAFASAEEKKQ